jgi:hypothetical protein
MVSNAIEQKRMQKVGLSDTYLWLIAKPAWMKDPRDVHLA